MPHIPFIHDDNLAAATRQIRPLMRFMREGANIINAYELGRDPTIGELYTLKDGRDPRETFVDRKPNEPAPPLREVARCTILIMHNSGFLPSEAEVIAQVPPAFADVITAYEVLPDEVRHMENDRHSTKSYRRAIAVFYAHN